MSRVSFDVTDEELELINRIVDRAEALYKKNGAPFDRKSTHMDLTATHANGCPLRLADMLAGRDFDLVHGVAGIANCLNRRTGKIEGFFIPRYAVRQGGRAA